MSRPVAHKCLHCKKFFLPDRRNVFHLGVRHQKYCSEKACQVASHRAAQRKLRASPKRPKPEDEVERVRAWRAKQREQAQAKAGVLRDDCPSEVVDRQEDSSGTVVLRDDCLDRNPLIIGLISQLSGVLRDDIEPVLRSLHSRGQMILGKGPGIVNQN
jgi:hypothetical protein